MITESAGGARRSKKSTFAPWVVVMLVWAVGLAACSNDDTYLPALLADPMAGYFHPDLEVDFRGEIPKSFTPMGTENEPSITTGFVVRGDFRIEDTIASTEAAGWTFESADPTVSSDGIQGWSATKDLPEGLAALSITLLQDDAEEDWDLAIRLTFREEY